MKIIPIFVTAMALPFMALGQAPDQQQGMPQNQPNEEKAPVKKKKAHPGQPDEARPQTSTTMHQDQGMKHGSGTAARPETGTTTMHQGANAESRTTGVNKAQTSSSTKTQTKVVNKEEFRSTHTEVFSLGQHPKEFFVQRYGANHFRLIGNTYFVFVDGCWVAVDVVGFTFVERMICEGDPDFIIVY